MLQPSESQLTQVFDFQRSLRRGLATHTIPFEWGEALLNDAYPIVWDLNALWVDGGAAGLRATELIDEADRILGSHGLAHRKVNVSDADLGARLAAGFRKKGWTILQVVTMILTTSVNVRAAVEVVELDDPRFRAARRRFLRREPYGNKEESVAQLVGKLDAFKAATRFSAYGVPVGDVIASICELYSDGEVAQIEDVGTLEEHRGRGYASAVVKRAVDEAEGQGCTTIFLNADAVDWPKEMYARLGFEPASYSYEFTKPPGN